MSNEKKNTLDLSEETIVIGYYVQDFKEPQVFIDRNTGEASDPIDLHRAIINVLTDVDPERWGCEAGANGKCVMEIKIDLDNLPFVLGLAPTNFNVNQALDSLINKAVSLSYGFNSKGKPKIKRIKPLN